jgi:hypothetical protein
VRQRRDVEQLRVQQAADQGVDVAWEHVGVAADRQRLEGRRPAGPARREHLDRVSPAGKVPQDHLVAGEQGDGHAAGVAAGPGGGAGGLPARRLLARGGRQQRGGDHQDEELVDTSLGGHGCLPRSGFVPAAKFARSAPSVHGAKPSVAIL